VCTGNLIKAQIILNALIATSGAYRGVEMGEKQRKSGQKAGRKRAESRQNLLSTRFLNVLP
jgi:hypothetical protein